MHVFMQSRPVDGESPRHYTLRLEQDLLGSWVLHREWGSPGGRSGGRREIFAEHDSALAAFERIRDQQLKRGFNVMFARGDSDKLIDTH